MECGGRSHRYRRHAKQQASVSSAATSGMKLLRSNNPPNANLPTNLNPSQVNDNNPTMSPNPTQCTVREQDQYMPIANVVRIMRRILPAHAKISDDAKETIQECVSEYIRFITGEANDHCQLEQRKTITAEDVLCSMRKLGFDDYVEPLNLFLKRYREAENDSVLKRKNVGVVNYGNTEMPPFMSSFAMGPPPPPQGVFDPAMFGAYYRDVSDAGAGMGGSSSSNNPSINFDPFAQFK